jgi:hypothetical protein
MYDRMTAVHDKVGMLDAPHRKLLIEAAAMLGVHDVHLAVARGRNNVLAGRWQEAAEEYAALSDWHGTGDKLRWFERACAQLMANDIEGYRRTCQEMLRAAGPTPDPQAASILARTCSLVSKPLVEPALLTTWAQQGVENFPGTWAHHAHVLALCRAGQFGDALMSLHNVPLKFKTEASTALYWTTLTLVHSRLQQTDDARQAWERAQPLFRRASETIRVDQSVIQPADWAQLNVLRREANQLLEDSAMSKRADLELSKTILR